MRVSLLSMQEFSDSESQVALVGIKWLGKILIRIYSDDTACRNLAWSSSRIESLVKIYYYFNDARKIIY